MLVIVTIRDREYKFWYYHGHDCVFHWGTKCTWILCNKVCGDFPLLCFVGLCSTYWRRICWESCSSSWTSSSCALWCFTQRCCCFSWGGMHCLVHYFYDQSPITWGGTTGIFKYILYFDSELFTIIVYQMWKTYWWLCIAGSICFSSNFFIISSLYFNLLHGLVVEYWIKQRSNIWCWKTWGK